MCCYIYDACYDGSNAFCLPTIFLNDGAPYFNITRNRRNNLNFVFGITFKYTLQQAMGLLTGGHNFIVFKPFRTAVSFWGQTIQISSSLSPKQDHGLEGLKSKISFLGEG